MYNIHFLGEISKHISYTPMQYNVKHYNFQIKMYYLLSLAHRLSVLVEI